MSQIRESDSPSPQDPRRAPFQAAPQWMRAALVALTVITAIRLLGGSAEETLSYSQFKRDLNGGKIERVVISDSSVQGRYRASGAEGQTPKLFSTARIPDDGLVAALESNGVEFTGRNPSPLLTLLGWLAPVLIFVAAWFLIMKRFGPAQGGVMSFGKSKAKIVAEDANRDHLRRRRRAGGGEGRAQRDREASSRRRSATERSAASYRAASSWSGLREPERRCSPRPSRAKPRCRFFRSADPSSSSCSSAWARRAFATCSREAQKKAPCIVFIDELDALGKARGIGGMVGGHDERENTFNQLLVEMDGFDTTAGVVILAATNRPEVLDPALLRAGRFDRQVLVDRPDRVGREAILRVHARAGEARARRRSRRARPADPGFRRRRSGQHRQRSRAAGRASEQDEVSMCDFDEAIDRVVAGLEKKNRLINPEEKRTSPSTSSDTRWSPRSPRGPTRSTRSRSFRAAWRARIHAAAADRGPLPDDARRARGKGRRPPRRPRGGSRSSSARSRRARTTTCSGRPKSSARWCSNTAWASTLGALTYPKRRGAFLGDQLAGAGPRPTVRRLLRLSTRR